MTDDQLTDIRVELTYRPTAEDFAEALKGRSKAAKSSRRARVLTFVMLGCAVIGGALSLAGGKGVDPVFTALVVVAVVSLLLLPRLQARQLHRLAAANGEFRVTVDGTGVGVRTERSSSQHSWEAVPRFVETPGLFLLLSGDRNASCLTLLPKRGLADPADVDRLRAILEHRLSAVRRRPRPAPPYR
ncbi:YcxB family protein [Kitasatospora camelliae]|uniref:YcxB family protein n=1 Tax=Kitasatospora camelliae TaxID=3156397 RepID=A0AAU8JSF1_9ACTN